MNIRVICLLIICILFNLLGCDIDEDKGEKTDELISCIDTVFSDGKLYSICKGYYPTGELKRICRLKEDTILSGPYVTYYKNGRMKDSAFYVGNAPVGIYVSYYPNDSLKQVAEYILLEGSSYSYRNISIEYDSITGEVDLENSFYFDMDLSSNYGRNISPNVDSLIISFNFEIPLYDSSYITMGNYDNYFHISNLDKENLQVVPVKNNKAAFKVPVRKNKEEYVVRGVIHNFNKKDTTQHRNFYFYEKYDIVNGKMVLR
ncbi:MAG TPA: hypothetical protein VIN73_00635 [Vicingaceae bacterium]